MYVISHICFMHIFSKSVKIIAIFFFIITFKLIELNQFGSFFLLFGVRYEFLIAM